jgi:diadenosine tetraphosphate (Ap4A) HIT family hydrolase
VILTKRRIERFPDLSRRETVDLRQVIAAFEELLGGCFQPARFNYVISGQHDPLLHLHAFPRYSSNVSWHRRDWVDHRWPNFLTFPEVDANPLSDLMSLAELFREEVGTKKLLDVYEEKFR